MNYAEMMKLFNTRKKGRDYKVFRNAWEHIRLDPDSGALTLSNNCSLWEKEVDGKHYRKVSPGTPVLRFTPDNVLEILHSPNATALADRLMIEKATGGRVYIRSPKFEYRLMLQFAAPRRDIPLVAGLKIDLNTKQPINKPDQIKRSTNRTTAQPVYQHVRQVGKVMDILWRLDSIDVSGIHNYRRLEIPTDSPHEMCEETLALHAELALRAGWERGQVSQWDHSRHVQRPEADIKAEKYAKAREHGLKRLTEFLKLHHGAIVRTVVS